MFRHAVAPKAAAAAAAAAATPPALVHHHTAAGSRKRARDLQDRRRPSPAPPTMRAAAAAAIGAAAARARPIAPLPIPLPPSSARRRALEVGAGSPQGAAASSATSNAAAAAVEETAKGITLLAVGERGTRALARLLALGNGGGGGESSAAAAARQRAGDCYFLHGPVGAGKSAFSRAFVRAAAGDPRLPVPSPTFLLVNTYDVGQEEEEEEAGGGGNGSNGGPSSGGGSAPDAASAAPRPPPPPPIHHFDLYRLDPAKTSPAELVRLDIPGALASGVALVEWPERLVAIAASAAAGSAAVASSTAATTTATAAATTAAATPPSLGLVPASRVDVFVEPLADDDPRRAALADALRRGSRGDAAGVRATPLFSGGLSGDDEEEDDDDDDDDDDGPYADRRWRRWTLVPTSREWEDRLRELVRRAAEGGEAGADGGAARLRGAVDLSPAGGSSGLFLIAVGDERRA